MKLSTKGRYAVMAMADLAKYNVKKPTSLTEISLRQGISISYLGQLFLKLRKNNLVQSERGPSGGYVLTKPPEEIKFCRVKLEKHLGPQQAVRKKAMTKIITTR